MNGKMKKLLALLLILCLSLGCLAACGQSGAETQPEAGPADDAIVQAASKLLPNHGDAAGKEETVYVIADANGKPERTIVSAWLKNPEEADTIADRAELSNIQNVKGDESFTKAADGSLIWDAKGSDIYYQGDSKQELPLEVNIRYKLDGKEVKAKDLSGASGHLEMTFSYENKASRQEKIGGEDVTVYQPFFVVSCLVLDASKASAVEVTNGTTINSGEQVIVAGMAMPGLKESLGLDELEDADGEALDADLPETVTINADVTDFSLLTTVTLVENALLNDLDLDNVEGFDDLKDSVNKLVDASSQLVSGAGDLYDGAKTLSDGSGELSEGAAKLNAGAKDLAAGVETTQKRLASAAENMKTLSGNLDLLNSQVRKISPDSIKVDLEMLGEAETGLDQAKKGAETVSGQLKDVNFDDASKMLGQLQDAMTKSQTQVEQVKTAGSGIEECENAVKAALNSLSTAADGITDEAQRLEVQEKIQTVIAVANTAFGQSGELTTQLQDASAPELPANLNESLAALSASVVQLQDAADGVAQCAAGVTEIISGNGEQNLKTMLKELANLPDYVQALPGAVKQLNEGAGRLYQGLADGAKDAEALVSGAKELSAGAGSLKSGAKELDDGVKQVMDGASSLLDGLRTFDGDGVKVLSRLFEEDAQGFMDRLRAVQAYGEEYNNFSGLAEGMPGTVRFVIRTDSIGE